MHARCTWLQACLLVGVCIVSVLRLSSAAEVERQVAVDFASRPTFLDSETIKLLPKELASSMIEMKAQVPTPAHSTDPFQDHSLKLDSDGIPIPARQTVHFTKHVPASHARFRFRSAPTPVRNDDVSNTKSSHTSPRVKVHNSHPNHHVAADGAVFQRGHYFDKARFRSIRSDEAPDFKAAYNEDDISHHAVDDQSEVTPLRRATAHVSAKEAEHRQTMHEQMMKHLSEETSGSEAGSSEESSSESAESSTSESSESAESAESSSESPSESVDGSESVGEPAREPSMSNSMLQSSYSEHSSVVGGANYESQFSDEADEDYEVTPAQLAMDQQKMQQQQQSNPRFMQTNSLPYGGAPGNYDGHPPSMGLFPPRDGRDDPLTDGAGSRVRPGEGHFSGRGANAPRFRSSSSSRILQGIMYARQQRAAQRRMANGRAQFQDAQMNEPGNPDMSPMMMNGSPMMMQQRAFQPSAGMDDGGGMMMPGAPAGMDPRMMGGMAPMAPMASMTPMAPMANPGMMMQGQQPLPQFNLPPSLDDTQEPLMLEQESSIHVSNSENHRHHSTGGPITDRLGEMRFAQRFGSEADSGTSAFDGPAGSPGGGLSSLAPGPRSISRIRDPSIPDAPAMEPSPSALNNNAPRMTPGGLTEEIYTPPHVVL